MPRRCLKIAIAAGLVSSLHAADKFGPRLVAELSAEKPQQNVFVSPVSVAMALGMAGLGAEKEGRAAIEKTVGSSPQQLADLSRGLRNRDHVELSIANAIWSDLRFKLTPSLISQARELFSAEARKLDFHAPDAPEVINAWVRQETHGKIDGIVNRQQVAGSQMILTNAVYFKGLWVDPFPKQKTAQAAFKLAGGGERQVQFMHATTLTGAYHSGPGFEAAVLPYQGDMEMWVILPQTGTRPESVLLTASVTGPGIDLELKMPKFTMNFDASLKPALARVGMHPAFEVRDGFYIGDVLHRTRLEIDEEGTVAVAVTAVLAPTAMAPQRREKKVLVVDRPFAIVLADRRTGAMLFAGVIYDPK